MNHYIKILIIACFLSLCYSSLVYGIEITLIEESEDGITLHIENQNDVELIIYDEYTPAKNLFRLKDFSFYEVTDYLTIPYWHCKIALPSPNQPTITISNLEFKSQTLDTELTLEIIELTKQKRLVEITNIGFLGDVPAGVLEVFPLQVTEKNSEINVLKSADIYIKFTDRYKKQEGRIDIRKDDVFYETTFLNSKMAKEWRYPRKLILEKPVEYPAGKWAKITVKENGIYLLSYEKLKELGIVGENINVNRIYLFSNSTGGRELTSQIGTKVPDNLTKNSKLITGSDNVFSMGDSIIFYGRSSSGIDISPDGKLRFNRNAYSFNNYYWLLIADETGSPKIMEELPSLSDEPDYIITETEVIDRHELEYENFLHSGLRWYGERFSKSGSSVSVLFTLPGNNSSYFANIKIRTKGATEKSSSNYFKFYINNDYVGSWSSTSFYCSLNTFSDSLSSGLNIFRIDYSASPSSAEAYLDYIELNYNRELKPKNEPMHFFSPYPISGILKYEISSIEYNNPVVFDITDWKDVKIQETNELSANAITFTTTTSSEIQQRKHYYITAPQFYKEPEKIKLIDYPSWNTLRNNENNADYIIITDEKFIEAAEIIAQLHSDEVNQSDRLKTLITTQEQIFKEFNADIPDPHAIRFFLKYAFENWRARPQYVLLIGDGTYDYRGIESSEENYIFTYQVDTETESSGGFSSYTTDARYTYVNGSDKNMDIAIGRVPIRTLDEAMNYAEKLRKYILQPVYGVWRNTITLVADDPERPYHNEHYHIEDSENNIAKNIPKNFSLKKLYLLEFPEVRDVSVYGVAKPAATEAILEQLEKGTTIINYLGHGSPTVWAQEKALVMERDLGKINTEMKLPFWIAGTCSWGKFDEITTSCMPEALLSLNQNGAIAAFSATRGTVGSTNAAFIQSILKKWFTNDGIKRIRIGEVIQQVLNGSNSNNEKYVLFGDPALYLALPYKKVTFDPLSTDTLKALSHITISGKTEDDLHNYNGTGILNVYDSERNVTRSYLDRDKNLQYVPYTLPGELLFKGNIEISDGNLKSGFFVPKDLNYKNSYGYMNIIGWNSSDNIEVSGYYDKLVFSSSESVIDTVGPRIKIELKNSDFYDGDVVSSDSELKIKISDKHGINLTGQLGHNITIELRSDEINILINANEEFVYDLNSDTSGSLPFSLSTFEPDEYSITVKAWDNANNSSEVTSTFTLTTSSEIQLERVVNYPNPFKEETAITFFLTQPGEVKISIYTVRGLLIRRLELFEIEPGFHTVYWDGKDDYGDNISRGIYLYEVKAKSIDSNKTDTYIGKMVKTG
jgi:hypothetical protein